MVLRAAIKLSIITSRIWQSREHRPWPNRNGVSRAPTELSAALAAKKVSAVELAQDAIGRIERHDGKINAICVRDFERGLEAARAADAALARGETRPLLGIPMTVKESYNVAGLPTTWGFPEHKDFVPPEDALSISRVKDAGGVILGKTNVPVGLGDWQSYNEIYGTTNNPFDLGRTPGGSSGGSSAALAAGYGALSLGSDIGGSLRVPAFHCGVYAHKPTFALVPSRGHTPPPLPPLPFDRDLSVIGPMARSAADLSLLLDVIAGPDPMEAGIGLSAGPAAAAPWRVEGFSHAADRHPSGDADRQRGARRDRETRRPTSARPASTWTRQSPLLPDFAASSRLYMRMLLSFLAASFQPEIYAGAQAPPRALPDDMSLARRAAARRRAQPSRLGHGRPRPRAAAGAMARIVQEFRCGDLPGHADAGLSARSFAGQEARRIAIDGKDYVYPDQLAWPGIATLPGLPATAIPLGLSPDGLPIGVQIVGPWLEDRTPLKLAELIEREFGGFVPPPMFDD